MKAVFNAILNTTEKPSTTSVSGKNALKSPPISNGIDKSKSLITGQNKIAPFKVLTTTKRTTTTHDNTLTPFLIAKYMVDQFNHLRHLDIMSRIKRCDPTMKLYEMCETFLFDNHSYTLKREPFVEFQSFQHIYDALVDRLVIQKLNRFCSPGHWCLNNLTQEDQRFTIDIIRQRGHSFCSLNLCRRRLTEHIKSCPSISNRVNFDHMKLVFSSSLVHISCFH